MNVTRDGSHFPELYHLSVHLTLAADTKESTGTPFMHGTPYCKLELILAHL